MNKKSVIYKKIERLKVVRSRKKKRKIRRGSIAAICAVLLFGLLAWAIDDFPSPGDVFTEVADKLASIGFGRGFPREVEGGDVPYDNFALLDGEIAFVGKTNFHVFNGFGREISVRPHGMGRPILKTGGGRALIYDSGGRKYGLESCSKTLRTGEADNDLICGAVSKSGVYGITTESRTYLAETTIFDRRGNEIYKYYFAQYYICDMAVRGDGREVAVCGVSSKDGGLSSAVCVFDLKSEEPKAVFEYGDDIISSVSYFKNGNLAAIGGKALSVIEVEKGARHDFDYGGKRLSALDVNEGNGIACALKWTDRSGSCEVVLIDARGDVKFRVETNRDFNSIACGGDVAVGLENGSAFSYVYPGKPEGRRPAGNEASRKILLRGRGDVYVLDTEKINKISLK